jgi:hypothetical protein
LSAFFPKAHLNCTRTVLELPPPRRAARAPNASINGSSACMYCRPLSRPSLGWRELAGSQSGSSGMCCPEDTKRGARFARQPGRMNERRPDLIRNLVVQKGVEGCRNNAKKFRSRKLGKRCAAQHARTAWLKLQLRSPILKLARSSVSIAVIAASAFGTSKAKSAAV